MDTVGARSSALGEQDLWTSWRSMPAWPPCAFVVAPTRGTAGPAGGRAPPPGPRGPQEPQALAFPRVLAPRRAAPCPTGGGGAAGLGSASQPWASARDGPFVGFP